MTLGLLFWVIMTVWLLFGLYTNRTNYPVLGNTLLIWIVLAILGWQVFGPVIKH